MGRARNGARGARMSSHGSSPKPRKSLQSRPVLFEHGLLPIPNSMPSVEQLCDMVSRGGEGRLTITAWHKIAKESFKMDTVDDPPPAPAAFAGAYNVLKSTRDAAGEDQVAGRILQRRKWRVMETFFPWRPGCRIAAAPHLSQRLTTHTIVCLAVCPLPEVSRPSPAELQGYAQLVFEIFFDCLDGHHHAEGGGARPEGGGDSNDVDVTEFAIYLFVLGSYR